MPSVYLGKLNWHVPVFEGELAVFIARADVPTKNKPKSTPEGKRGSHLRLSIENERDCNIKVLAISIVLYTL